MKLFSKKNKKEDDFVFLCDAVVVKDTCGNWLQYKVSDKDYNDRIQDLKNGQKIKVYYKK